MSIARTCHQNQQNGLQSEKDIQLGVCSGAELSYFDIIRFHTNPVELCNNWKTQTYWPTDCGPLGRQPL